MMIYENIISVILISLLVISTQHCLGVIVIEAFANAKSAI